MSELTERLAQYGVNIPEVMERFVDDEELYLSCLHIFVKDAPSRACGTRWKARTIPRRSTARTR